MLFLQIFIPTFSFIIGFLWGKYSERIAWNKLIKKGIIPRPHKRDNGNYKN